MKSRVVVAAVIEYKGKILLGRREKDRGPYPNCWLIPGGGVRLGQESIIDAIKREVKEETGLEIKNIQHIDFDEDHEPNRHGEMTQYVFLEFKAECESGDVKADSDLNKLRWFDVSELKDLELARPTIKMFTKMGYL